MNYATDWDRGSRVKYRHEGGSCIHRGGRPASGRRLSEPLRSAFFDHAEAVEVSVKSYIYTLGCSDSHLYIVDSGLVKTLTCTASGKSCILGVHARGDVFGDSCLLEGGRREAAVALTEACVLRVPKTEFTRSVADRGLVADWLVYQAGRMQEQHEAITLLVTTDSELRLAATILMLVEKLGMRRDGRTVITGRLTHEDLGQIVGTTRSRIGLFLKRFEESGLVLPSRDSHLVIDEPRLRAYLSTRGLRGAGAQY